MWKKTHPAALKKLQADRKKIENALDEVFPPTESFVDYLGDVYQKMRERKISRAREFGHAHTQAKAAACSQCGEQLTVSPKRRGVLFCTSCNKVLVDKKTWEDPNFQADFMHHKLGIVLGAEE